MTSEDSTINEEEVHKFSKMAHEWWNPKGPFKQLHLINPVRISFIKQRILAHYDISSTIYNPFKGLKIIDIGCGGGLLSVPMSRLGANVTGIDVSGENIDVAKNYATKVGININYVNSTIEAYAESHHKKYDVVLCSEVLEHVDNLERFFASLRAVLKDDGMVIISTINKTLKSYLLVIGIAEYLLRYLPVGTHNFNKFLKPTTVSNLLLQHGLTMKLMRGMSYNPLLSSWSLTDDISVNYIVYASAI